MQVPQLVEEEDEQPERGNRLRRPRPNTYDDEMYQRRRQVRLDEDIARRLQALVLEEEAEDDDNHPGGIGEVHGIGNNAGHFMNQDYIRAAHNILTGSFDQATAAANYVMGVAQARGVPLTRPDPEPRRRSARPQVDSPAEEERPAPPPPMLRRHTAREETYNSARTTRPSERVVPRRTRTDYASEAAVHAPLERSSSYRSSNRGAPRPSVLAGLGGPGKGSGRVNAWRTHVEPGAPPDEGALSA